MGNYRFKFSSLIPNSWLHSSTTRNKLNNKITKTQSVTSPSSSLSSSQRADYQRKSYYFTRDLTIPDPKKNRIQDPSTGRTHHPDVRRKSSKRQPRRKLVSPPEMNPTATCSSCRITPETVSTDSESSSEDSEVKSPEQSLTCSCKTSSSYDVVYEKVDLAPIKTNHAKQTDFGSGKWVIEGGSRNLSLRVVKEGIIGISTTNTRSPVSRKLKGNGYSPRLGNRVRINGINGVRRRNGNGNRNENGNRRSLTESMAVVKTSVNPGRDFRESMVEMITENKMKSPKELEDLLACYLALNSDQYHDLIIKVFKQIWIESSDIRV